jgi:large subunit ribosomal protein L25
VADYELDVELRQGTGKGVARKLRAAGRIPAVCYGGDAGATPIEVDPRALERMIAQSAAGLNTLIDLKGGGSLNGKIVLLKELQRDPVRGRILHADFYAVDLQRKVHVSVPIHLFGSPPGVKMGGILDQPLRELELECLPRAIPEEIRLDVGELEIGDSLHVRDIPLPEGVALVSDPELSVASVAAPSVAEEAAPAVEEAAEVVEGAEGAAPAPAAEGGED